MAGPLEYKLLAERKDEENGSGNISVWSLKKREVNVDGVQRENREMGNLGRREGGKVWEKRQRKWKGGGGGRRWKEAKKLRRQKKEGPCMCVCVRPYALARLELKDLWNFCLNSNTRGISPLLTNTHTSIRTLFELQVLSLKNGYSISPQETDLWAQTPLLAFIGLAPMKNICFVVLLCVIIKSYVHFILQFCNTFILLNCITMTYCLTKWFLVYKKANKYDSQCPILALCW